jgi:hypothetical protein
VEVGSYAWSVRGREKTRVVYLIFNGIIITCLGFPFHLKSVYKIHSIHEFSHNLVG